MSIDFIGPAIDTGFRIAAKATPRRFCLTLDLALLLSKCLDIHPMPLLKVWYDGEHAFKGVIGGNLYPVFWIDVSMNDELIKLEAKLTKSEDIHGDDLKRYCFEFIKVNKNYLSKPFILGCGDAEFATPPTIYEPSYLELLTNIQAVLESEPVRAAKQATDVGTASDTGRQITPEDLQKFTLLFNRSLLLKEEVPAAQTRRRHRRSKPDPKSGD